MNKQRTKLDMENIISNLSNNNEIACNTACGIAESSSVATQEVGEILDRLNIKLIQCQLGLFGYYPDKKVIQPQPLTNQSLSDLIGRMLIKGKLPCKNAWDIADKLNISKKEVSCGCETLGIKISSCQLGAF